MGRKLQLLISAKLHGMVGELRANVGPVEPTILQEYSNILSGEGGVRILTLPL